MSRAAFNPSGEIRPGAVHWQVLLECFVFSCWPVGLTWALKPSLMHFWQTVMSFWAAHLGGTLAPLALRLDSAAPWVGQSDGTSIPSNESLLWTWLGLFALWGITLLLSDRLHPLRVFVRALCLIQASACLFFMLAPASFPYTLSRHSQALLDMGYGLMLATGPMLALGWGIFVRSVTARLLTPLAVLAYFALMLPHKVLLHAWILDKGSALFMPVLFLCFGSWLDLWIFIALYGGLASLLPRGQLITGQHP